MKIKSKIQLIAIIYFCLAIIVWGILNNTAEKINYASEKTQVADEVLDSVFDLNILTGDYMLHHQARAEIQWRLKHKSIQTKLGKADEIFNELEEKQLLKKISRENKNVGVLFDKLVENQKKRNDLSETELSGDLQERLASQLMVKTRSMVSDTFKLQQMSGKELVSAQKQSDTGIVIVTLLVTAGIIGTYYTIIKDVVKPLGVLQKGAREISEGKLDHKVNIESKNEIGELAKAFNEMTGKLSKLYYSLHREVDERKQAEETMMFQTRELKRAKKEVEKHAKELEKKTVELENSRRATINILEDVSKAKQELEKANEKLQKMDKVKEIDKLKNEFLGITTHELKTPLTPIKIQAQMWLSGNYGKIDKARKNSMEIILRNTTRLASLLDDIMTITKIDQKRLAFNFREEDITSILKTVGSDAAAEAAQKGLYLKTRIPKNLPKVKADRNRIMQVISDLINNAMKFTEKGGITLEAQKTGNYIQLSITDTGVGIPKGELKKIFSRFYQVDHTITRKHRGTGLGLSIVESIIKTHGGRIWAESGGLGKGSAFYFTLPIIKEG